MQPEVKIVEKIARYNTSALFALAICATPSEISAQILKLNYSAGLDISRFVKYPVVVKGDHDPVLGLFRLFICLLHGASH